MTHTDVLETHTLILEFRTAKNRLSRRSRHSLIQRIALMESQHGSDTGSQMRSLNTIVIVSRSRRAGAAMLTWCWSISLACELT